MKNIDGPERYIIYNYSTLIVNVHSKCTGQNKFWTIFFKKSGDWKNYHIILKSQYLQQTCYTVKPWWQMPDGVPHVCVVRTPFVTLFLFSKTLTSCLTHRRAVFQVRKKVTLLLFYVPYTTSIFIAPEKLLSRVSGTLKIEVIEYTIVSTMYIPGPYIVPIKIV